MYPKGVADIYVSNKNIYESQMSLEPPINFA